MTHCTGEDMVGYFARYRAEIHRFLRRMVGCEHTAHDLTQDIYLRLIDCRQDQIIENPRAFMYRIANNLALDYLRTQTRRERLWEGHEAENSSWPQALEALNPQNIVQQQQQLLLLQAAIQDLPELCREIFIRSRFLGQTHDQIARELAISKSWVEKNIVDALKRCKSALAEPADL